jgi:hypothetical protein
MREFVKLNSTSGKAKKGRLEIFRENDWGRSE